MRQPEQENEHARMAYLMDFYGNALTEKQREALELYYQDDLSLSEAADLLQITRQGVRQRICQGTEVLEKAEARFGTAQRFSVQRQLLKKALALCEITPGTEEISSLLKQALEEA